MLQDVLLYIKHPLSEELFSDTVTEVTVLSRMPQNKHTFTYALVTDKIHSQLQSAECFSETGIKDFIK